MCVFGHIDKFGKDMKTKLRKTHAKTRIKGIFSYLKNMCLGCVFKSPKPFYEDEIQWQHQNFGGHRGGKMRFWGGNIQIFAKNGLFWSFFSSDGGQGGKAEPQTAEGNVPMPTLMPPLMISSLKYKCPPESKLIYEYRENTWKIV